MLCRHHRKIEVDISKGLEIKGKFQQLFTFDFANNYAHSRDNEDLHHDRLTQGGHCNTVHPADYVLSLIHI